MSPPKATSSGIAFIHGGMHGSWCWDRVRPLLTLPSIAPDLPGRGDRPSPVHALHVADFVAAVVADLDATGWTEVTLVAHSIGGLTALGLAAARPELIRHIIFVSCLTPPPGAMPLTPIQPPLRWYLVRRMRRAVEDPGGVLDLPPRLARRFFCSDLDEADSADVLQRCVPDAPSVLLDPTPTTPLPDSIRRTWVRLTRDRALLPRVQDRLRTNVEPAEVVELAAGHDAMISRPVALAAIIERMCR